MHKFIGVIGSRTLPEEYREKARGMVRYLLDKGYGIASGGAVGADAYALDALLELGQAHRGVILALEAYHPVPRYSTGTGKKVHSGGRQGRVGLCSDGSRTQRYCSAACPQHPAHKSSLRRCRLPSWAFPWLLLHYPSCRTKKESCRCLFVWQRGRASCCRGRVLGRPRQFSFRFRRFSPRLPCRYREQVLI